MNAWQRSVATWISKCFPASVGYDKQERGHRFLEEALELVQAGGCTKDEALKLVDYVFSRPVGEVKQEVGGVMVCLAALCTAHDVQLDLAAWCELERNWANIDKIRAKWEAKPKFGPLPAISGGP